MITSALFFNQGCANSQMKKSRYVGKWAVSRGNESLIWEFNGNGKFFVYKDGDKSKSGMNIEWNFKQDGSVSMKTPEGLFTAHIDTKGNLIGTPPAEFREEAVKFKKID